MSSSNQASIAAVFGATGSGKSAAVKQFLTEKKPPRLLIWDTMDEYGGHAPAAPSLKAIAESELPHYRYVPRGTDAELAARFAAFCSIAYAFGDLCLIVEELQRVTRPASAPASWSDCTLRGRHRALRVIGLSQRPASVDKNFFSNATVIRCGRLNFADDVQCMANVLGVDRERIQGLAPLHYIERDMLTGELRQGAVSFGPAPDRRATGGAAAAAPAAARRTGRRRS